jgi:hypothetical protein
MPDENELEELTNKFLDDMIMLKGVDFDGRKTEQTEVVGVMAKHCIPDCVSGENVLQN